MYKSCSTVTKWTWKGSDKIQAGAFKHQRPLWSPLLDFCIITRVVSSWNKLLLATCTTNFSHKRETRCSSLLSIYIHLTCISYPLSCSLKETDKWKIKGTWGKKKRDVNESPRKQILRVEAQIRLHTDMWSCITLKDKDFTMSLGNPF